MFFFLLAYTLNNLLIRGAASSFSSPKINQKSYFSIESTVVGLHAITLIYNK